jgi:hypothetical protein
MEIDNERSQTFREFCTAEHISPSTLYGMLKRGLGPDVLEVPGTKIKRITPQARIAWRERMAELAKSKSAELERTRRHALAVAAGQAAAASPLHVSKRARSASIPARQGRRG